MGIYSDLNKYTQAALLQTALGEARDDVDKREGSILYDALAPLAFLTARLMEVVRSVAENADLQTAQGEHLDWAASQFGIYREEAVSAVREAQATPEDVNISTGEKFKTDAGLGLIWECTDILENGKIVLQCQTSGAEGGADYGELAPVGNVEGLRSLVFTDTRNAGIDAETDKDFRIRFWRELQRESYGGNFADYQKWIFTTFARQPNGAKIKGVSFFPAWNGGGTVKIVPYVENDNNALDTPTLGTLEALKEYLDPVPVEGCGAGVAPVGHEVTIETPTFETWNITAEVVLKTGQTEISESDAEKAAEDVKAALEAEMLASVTKAEDGYPTTEQYTFNITRLILATAIIKDSINRRFEDVVTLKINGIEFVSASHTQTATQHIMPKFGSLTLTKYEGAA